jgi:anaerobic selenocysteine-containing dehydrogenase
MEEGIITSVKASTENPVTAGITCPRASGDPSKVYSMQRVMYPYILVEKREEKFRLGEWDEALDLVARKLNETIEKHGPESILLLDYAGNVGLNRENSMSPLL